MKIFNSSKNIDFCNSNNNDDFDDISTGDNEENIDDPVYNICNIAIEAKESQSNCTLFSLDKVCKYENSPFLINSNVTLDEKIRLT